MSNTRDLVSVSWSDWHKTYQRSMAADEVLAFVESMQSIWPNPPPIISIFEDASGRSLGIGVGRNETVLTFQDSLDPPYYVSVGNPRRDGVVWFCHGEEESEYLARNLVGWESALKALKEFVFNRKLPLGIQWEQL